MSFCWAVTCSFPEASPRVWTSVWGECREAQAPEATHPRDLGSPGPPLDSVSRGWALLPPQPLLSSLCQQQPC